jgi:cytochrome c-type biogenesis protein CcsB
LGGLLLMLSFAQILFSWKWLRYAAHVLAFGILLVFLFHAFGMGLRWYVSGHEAPWSNSYETMVYVSWVTLLAGLIYGRKNSMLLALATLFGGVILFVASLNWMNPQITTLVPVLQSPWLLYHVSTNVAAYGFFGVSFLLGIVNMLIMTFATHKPLVYYKIKELTIINHMSLLVGLALMTIGAFLGAVWANESWGRYWGWDPKETWALVTIVVYTIVTHLYLVRKWDNEWLLNLLSSLAFSSVLMTYLGVNFLLSGLHSYGQTADNMPFILACIGIVFLFIGVLGVVSYGRFRKMGRGL